jgi:uncharacterized protein
VRRYLLRVDFVAPGFGPGSVKSIGGSLGVDVRNPKTTSRGSVELDAFAPTAADFDLFLAAVGPLCKVEYWRDLNEAPLHLSDEEVVTEARGYFSSERYWECHESLEGLWRRKSGDEKNFLQGLILVCAAFVHHQKGEDEVARSVLKRGARQLVYPDPTYRGITVKGVSDHVAPILAGGPFVPFEI